jgi:hypothetical protein
MQDIEFTNDEFKTALDEIIAANVKDYKEAQAEANKHKTRLKRTPFGNLLDSGRLNSDYMIDEAANIQAKTSTLPAGERRVITSFINAAALRALQAIQDKLPKQPAIKTAKRTKKAK